MTTSDHHKLLTLTLLIIGLLVVSPFVIIYVAHNNPPSPVAGSSAPWLFRK